ncbi:MAG: hypothetical protein M1827_006856 [Pycnora praestabilis]|nr:MAG: hypothetical protein M1827_006856 [Pycnora praestabilis]
MVPIPSARQYELVVFGATGYTGQLCAEHITTHLPTDLRWAIAGRTMSKLTALKDHLRTLNPDRLQPDVEIVSLNKEELHTLAKRTRLLITTVGPYYLYGTPVLGACASNGTHYLDVTGESPWVLEMIQKYDATAKANGAIIIPMIGIESAPADLVSLALVSFIKDQLSLPTKEIISSIYHLKGAPSGGTMTTVFGVFSHYSLSQISSASKSWALSPLPGPASTTPTPFLTLLTGVRTVPELGVLTTSISAKPNRAVVERSWGLQAQRGTSYGANFQYSEYANVRNVFVGALINMAYVVAAVCLAVPPMRWLLKKIAYAPGQGPTKDQTSTDLLEYRAIGYSDAPTAAPATQKRALTTLKYTGGLYGLTGIFLAEAAMTILRDEDESLPEKLGGGGLLTPAMLGQGYVERLKRVEGFSLETRLLDT